MGSRTADYALIYVTADCSRIINQLQKLNPCAYPGGKGSAVLLGCCLTGSAEAVTDACLVFAASGLELPAADDDIESVALTGSAAALAADVLLSDVPAAGMSVVLFVESVQSDM